MQNVHGESNAKLNLNIEADPEPEGFAPTFIEKPRIESSADGKKVSMYCRVKADPKPSVVWTRDGVVVRETSRISTTIIQERDTYAIKLELLVRMLYFRHGKLVLNNNHSYRILTQMMPDCTNAPSRICTVKLMPI